MTPRQIDRAVRRALAECLPPVIIALRDEMTATLTRHLAVPEAASPVAEPAVPPEVMQAALAVAEKALRGPPGPDRDVAAAVASVAAVAGGRRPRSLATDDKWVEARRLYEQEGLEPAEIGRRLDLGQFGRQRVSDMRRHHGWTRAVAAPIDPAPAPAPAPPAAPAPSTIAASAPDQSGANPVFDEAAFRAAWADPMIRRMDMEPTFGLSRHQLTAKAEELGLGHKAVASPNILAVAAPPNTSALEPVPATVEDARDWLYAELQREGGKRVGHVEIEQRLAILTDLGVLAECNARRVQHGLSPYAIVGRSA